MPGVMATDGGPHPAEKWAVMTGEHIFPIDPRVEGDRLIQARKVQTAICEALLPHHSSNMERERGHLKKRGDARLDVPEEPEEEGKAALATVVGILAGTPWEKKSQDPEWQRVVLQELCTHFATAQNIERQWHCHRNPSERAKAFLETHHPVVPAEGTA